MALFQAAAIIKLTGISTGTTSPMRFALIFSTRRNPFPKPAIKPKLSKDFVLIIELK